MCVDDVKIWKTYADDACDSPNTFVAMSTFTPRDQAATHDKRWVDSASKRLRA